jgi:hypothetical protein
MAITKKIIIEADASQAISETNKLEKSLESVDRESEKTKTGLKEVGQNGGAIAILDSLTGGLATRMRDAYEATKLFNLSLKGTGKALIATGIGALVVALGLVVAYWDEIKDAISGVNRKLQEQIDLSIEAQKALQLRVDLIDKQIKLNEKLGKGNEALQKQRIELVKQIREQNQAEIDGLILQNEKLRTSALELNTREKILKTVLNTFSAGSGDKFILDGQLESLAKYKETQDLILQAKGKQVDLDIKLFDLQNTPEPTLTPTPSGTSTKTIEQEASGTSTKTIEQEASERLTFLQQIEDAENEFFLSKLSKEEQEVVAVREKYFNLIEQAEIYGEDTLILEEAQRVALREINDKYDLEQEEKDKAARDKKKAEEEKAADEELKREQTISNLKTDIADQTSNLIQNIAKEGSAVAKGLAIANIVREQVASVSGIISNTAVANAKAVAASPLTLGQPFVTLNTISAGLGIAGGVTGAIKSIKAINSNAKSPQGGSGGGGGGGGGASAPSFNLVAGSGTNQIAEGISQQPTPLRAFVVSSEVTTAQSLDRNIESNASF